MAEPSSKRARTDAPVENPYLAHLNNPADRMTGGANGGKGGFEGWIPRKQGGKEVEAVMVRLGLSIDCLRACCGPLCCCGEVVGSLSTEEAMVVRSRYQRVQGPWRLAGPVLRSVRMILRAQRASWSSRRPATAALTSDFASSLALLTVAPLCCSQAGDFNPFNQRPFSNRYREIFEVRKKLPVHQQMDEFLKMFNANQFVVLSGETGSGKTTQCVAGRGVRSGDGTDLACPPGSRNTSPTPTFPISASPACRSPVPSLDESPR